MYRTPETISHTNLHIISHLHTLRKNIPSQQLNI